VTARNRNRTKFFSDVEQIAKTLKEEEDEAQIILSPKPCHRKGIMSQHLQR
jgi:hypothetical protein